MYYFTGYTCVAKNEAGIAKSTGFIERISDLNSICNIHSNLFRETTLPPLSTEGRGNSRERYSASRTKTTIHTTTVVHRSSSLPKRKASGESSRADSEIDSSLLVRTKSATPENFNVDDAKTPIIPNFVVFPPPQIYLSKHTKEPFELHVACQSNPPAQINWLINGKGLAEELKENEFRVLSEHNESRLLIECCGEGNELKEGIYTAEASNAYGTAKCETLVTISSDGALSTIEENGTDESENVTKIIQKRVERQEMFDEESDEEEDEFSIKNEREKEEDQEPPQFFVCTETTEEPLIEEVEQIHPLQQKRPKIVLAPESRIFVPGGLPLVLELKTESESDCTIRWYLRNFELHPNGNNIIIEQLERNNEKLTIQNPTEGIYKAVIQNDHGMATFECRVLVEVPPQSDDLPEFMQRSRDLLLKSPTPPPIFKPEKQRKKLTSDAIKRIDIAPKIINDFEEVYRLGENMPLELEVKAEARPEAQFQWKHNNFEIKPNDQIKIKHIGENQEKISFVRAIDGIIEVHAVNKLGKDIKRTKIIIDYDFEPSKKVIKKLSERRVDDELENDKKLKIEDKEADELKMSELTDLVKNEPDQKKLKKKKSGKEKQLAKTMNENELINIKKEEETYSLLIKVAESMADTLVANIFVNAIEEASQQLINTEKANKKKPEAQIKKKQKEENNASKTVASLEIDLVNDKLTENLDIMANIQMFELESEVKNVLPSMFTPKNKEKKKVASKQENEITKAKEASDKTEKSESINNEEISEEELAARLSQRRPSQQQLDNVNLQDMELLELVNRLRTVEGFLTEGEKNFPREIEKDEKIGEAKIGENKQQIVGDHIASEIKSKVTKAQETKEDQTPILNDLKDEINEEIKQSFASIKDNEILEIKEEKPEISSDISEKEAKLQLEIEQKIKQHRNEIEAQIAAKASNRPPSRSRAEIQIVVIEQEKTPPERKPEQPPAQAIPYGGKPKINKITLGVFLSLPPHVVSFNVYLLEANNEYVSSVIKMGSKKRSKSVDSIKLEEKQKLLQQPELLQKQNEEFKVKQEKIISQPEMLQKSKDDFQGEKQIEEKPIEKPTISIDEASPKNEKSLLESEGYFSDKLKEDEAKDVNSQMLVRLKPEVSLEKSEAEPLSDISERTEDISEASKVSSVPKRRKSKASLFLNYQP